MDNFLAISGWLFALGSLIVNIIQLRNNNKLKKQIEISSNNQQSHSGHGDNINVGGDANINKS